MAEHSLPKGRRVIASLLDLGRSMGYHSEAESEVVQNSTFTAPAVDVAWFRDTTKGFPLMIFEVESSATNAMANNAVKVYGQENSAFEKPLFFFHLVIKPAPESSRLNMLQKAFGTHNYRIYSLGMQGEKVRFLRDILSQHRRISATLDLASFCANIRLSDWELSESEAEEVLVAAEQMGFEFPDQHPIVSYFYAKDKTHALRLLKHAPNRALQPTPHFPSFIGGYYGEAFLAALKAHDSPDLGAKWLAEWRDRGGLSPDFGLSYHYDDFLVGVAGPLWVAIAAASQMAPQVVSFAIEQLCVLLNCQSRSFWGSELNLIWLAHLAAASMHRDGYDAASSFAEALGGIHRSSVLDPPSTLGEDDDLAPEEAFDDPTIVPMPSIDDFRKAALAHFGGGQGCGFDLACRILLEDQFFLNWSSEIAIVLWSTSGVQT